MRLHPLRSRKGGIAVGAGEGFQGKVGPWVFQRGPGFTMVRGYTKPVNPQTARQIAVRTTEKQLSDIWTNDITAALSADWSTYAQNTPILHPSGLTSPTSGRNMFIRNNFMRVFRLGPAGVSLTAPLTPGIADNAVPTFELNSANGELSLTAITPGVGPTLGRLSILISTLWPASKNFFKGPYFDTQFIEGVPVLPVLLHSFPSAPANTKCFVEFRRDFTVDNKVSSETRASVISV